MYISRANLSGCGIEGSATVYSSANALIHSSGAIAAGDYDLVTLYMGCDHSANTTASINSGQTLAATYRYIAASDAGSRVVLSKHQMPPGSTLQVSFAMGNGVLSLSGYVTQFRQSNTSPTLGSVAAYLGGWNSLTHSAKLVSFDYTSRTSSIITATLDEDRVASCGVFDSTYGYYIGGERVQGARWTEANGIRWNTNMKRLQFSNETVSNVAQSLASGVVKATGTMSSTAAYICGGDSATESQIEKFTFSTETRAAYGGVLPSSRVEITKSSASDTANAGYIFGGHNGSNGVNSIVKVSHSTVSVSTIGATLYASSRDTTVVQDSTYAFVKAGFNTSANDQTWVQRFVFSSETFSVQANIAYLGAGHYGGRTSYSGKGYLYGIESGSVGLGGCVREFNMSTGAYTAVPGGMPLSTGPYYISTVTG